MKKLHKRIIGASLPIPFLFAITFCCCLGKDASAADDISKSPVGHHQKSEKAHHSEHQHDSQNDNECSCLKHFSFLSEQSVDLAFDSSFNQMLAKNLMANLWAKDITFLVSLSNHSQGPPLEDRSDITVPIYLKISNLRL